MVFLEALVCLEDVKLLSLQLGLEKLQIATKFRLGREDEGRCRPLKVVLQNKSHKKCLLDNAICKKKRRTI